jgi:sugar lactone lactonase YvrE
MNRVLVDNLIFPESPRWEVDRFWFVDMFAGRVMTADLDGNTSVVAQFDDRPSGIGFLPDGSPIVVLMDGRKIVRINSDGSIEVHADLSAEPAQYLNDMVVDVNGRAYVDLLRDAPSTDHCIMLVEPDGTYSVGASGVTGRPNGLVITDDGKTLLAAESSGHRVTAFTIGADGSLRDSRVYADAGEDVPDGICLDQEGAVWIGSPSTQRFIRVREGGQILDTINVEGKSALACVLGGPDRRTLFMATSIPPGPNDTGLENVPSGAEALVANLPPNFVRLMASKGFMEIATVDVPGAGRP